MIGASISRWTMSYFAAALACLLIAEALMAAGYGFPAHAIRAPETLVVVHVATIGWLSLLMCGALHQFVPVLTARPLFSETLPLPALIMLLGGLAFLILGFLHLAESLPERLPFFALASGLLGAGFTLVLWNLGRTLWRARPLPLPAQFVTVGLFALAATLAYGIVFALALGGFLSTEPLLEIAAKGLPMHAAAGFGGWLTFTAMGVSYRLLAMFMLAPELDGRRPHAVLYSGTAALMLLVLGSGSASLFGLSREFMLAVAGFLGLIAVALYGADIIYIYRARKRRHIELNSRMATFALASLGAAVLTLVALIASGHVADDISVVVFLLAFGWLGGLGLSKLYKIVAFLTWLECYGPLLGRAETPRVQDLVVEGRAFKWFLGYFFTTWAAALALLAELPLLFRIAAMGMFVTTLGIAIQLLRARRLADVATELRLPDGASRPHLLWSLATPR